MNIRQLREALDNFSTGHDDAEIVVWLPGGRIALSGNLFKDPAHDKRWMIEGGYAPIDGTPMPLNRERLQFADTPDHADWAAEENDAS